MTIELSSEKGLEFTNKFFNTSTCNCGGCGYCHAKSADETLDNFQRGIEILDSNFNTRNKIDLCHLSPIDRLYLATYFRSGFQNDILSEWDKKLSPNIEFTNHILKYLLQKSYIYVSIGSFMFPYPEVVAVGRKKSVRDVNFLGLTYDYNISSTTLTEYGLYKELQDLNTLETSVDDLRKIWMLIAVEECIEFVLKQFGLHNISCEYADITKSKIKELLSIISVGQFCYLFKSILSIFLSGSNFERLGFDSLENLLIGEMQNEIKGKPELISALDCSDNEQSTISRLFFSKILKIYDQGYYECPANYQITL